jgi:hypothetical protein
LFQFLVVAIAVERHARRLGDASSGRTTTEASDSFQNRLEISLICDGRHEWAGAVVVPAADVYEYCARKRGTASAAVPGKST